MSKKHLMRDESLEVSIHQGHEMDLTKIEEMTHSKQWNVVQDNKDLMEHIEEYHQNECSLEVEHIDNTCRS